MTLALGAEPGPRPVCLCFPETRIQPPPLGPLPHGPGFPTEGSKTVISNHLKVIGSSLWMKYL